MTATVIRFLPHCADFLREHVLTALARCLAEETDRDAARPRWM